MPLPRPRSIRLVATAEDTHWCQLVERIIDEIPEPVTVDSSPPEYQGGRPSAVILIWTRNTTADAAVNREIVGWEYHRRINVHLLDVREAEVLGYMKDTVASIHIYTDDGGLKDWIRSTVLEVGEVQQDDQSQRESPMSFDNAVKAYEDALCERLKSIEIVGQEAPLALEEVYLPLKLRDVDDNPASPPTPETSLVDLVVGRTGQRLFVIGTPGSGKSTLLEYAAFQLAHLDESPGLLPLLLRAAHLVTSGYQNISEYLRLIVKGCVPRHGRQVSITITNADEFGDSRTFLLVDGVDELKREDRLRLRQLLRTFETEFPDANIVLSSRPSGYDSQLWSEYRAVALQPLEIFSARHYVQKFAPESNRQHLLQLLATSERLRELARVPFMVALMCSYEGEGEDLPPRRAALIRTCVNSLLSRRSLSKQSGLDAKALEQCFVNISDRLFRLDPTGGHGEAEFLFALQAFFTELPSRAGMDIHTVDKASLVLEEIIERTGLLQHDGEYIDFVHRSVWEYFVAVALAERDAESVDEVAGAQPWEEPIRLMIGLCSEERVRDLMPRLWVRNPALALRGAAESAYDLHDLLQTLLANMPAGEAAALVRDLAAFLPENDRERNERLVLDTLQVLLPEAGSCETLWEGLQLLLRVRERVEEAQEIMTKVFRLEAAASRLEQLVANEQTGVRFVDVLGGDFDMGNDSPGRAVDEGPRHRVRVSPFRLTSTPVTNAARSMFPFQIGTQGDARSSTDAQPMIGVTWYEAVVFALWFGCSLPTEAEWEYGCRAGGADDRFLCDEAEIPRYAWYAENAGNITHPVGTLEPNSFGIYDMLGNVREWCWDWYGPEYYKTCLATGTVVDPTGPETGDQKVLKGGCFDWNTTNLVPTYRNSNLPNNRGFQNGFRLVEGLPDFLAEYARSSDTTK